MARTFKKINNNFLTLTVFCLNILKKLRRASRAGFCFVIRLNSLQKIRRASRASFCFVILLKCPEKSPARFARRIRSMLEFEKMFSFPGARKNFLKFLKNFNKFFHEKIFEPCPRGVRCAELSRACPRGIKCAELSRACPRSIKCAELSRVGLNFFLEHFPELKDFIPN